MTRVALALSLLVLAAACGGAEDPAPEAAEWQTSDDDVGTDESALASSFDFRIPSGKHDSKPGGPRGLKMNVRPDRSVRFKLMFPAGNDYRTSNPANQSDFNKVMGITTNRIHHNSIRLGWAWNPAKNAMDLGFYGYTQGNRTMRVLKSLPLGQWADVELRLNRGGMKVRVDDQVFETTDSLGLSSVIPTTTWILCTAYFGGDETAPKELRVQVRDISHD